MKASSLLAGHKILALGPVNWADDIRDLLKKSTTTLTHADDWAAAEPTFGTGKINVQAVLVHADEDADAALEVLTAIKCHPILQEIPVIIWGKTLDGDAANTFFQEGAVHVVDRVAHGETIATVLDSAMAEFREIVRLRRDVASRASAVGSIMHGVFVLTNPDEARNLATMLSMESPRPPDTAVGLYALILDAIQRGNLEIDRRLRADLFEKGTLDQETIKRLRDPKFANRHVTLFYEQTGEGLLFRIAWDGHRGEAMADPATLDVAHGPWVVLARSLSFSSVEPDEDGRTVVARVTL